MFTAELSTSAASMSIDIKCNGMHENLKPDAWLPDIDSHLNFRFRAGCMTV
jgi:hypothetical protein